MNISMLVDLPAEVAGDQVILSDETRAVTYGQLRGEVARLATCLRRRDVADGGRVATFAMSSVRAVEVLLATAAVQGVCIPMNYRARRAELEYLMRDAQPRLVFGDPRYELDVRQWLPEGAELMLLNESLDAAIGAATPVDEFPSTGEDALLLYTSGTTAHPKAVRLTHTALSTFVLDTGEMADGSDRGSTIIAVPLYHIAGLTTLLVSLFSGRRMHLMREFDSLAWLQEVERRQITDAFLVPTMLKRILDENLDSFDLRSLRMVRYGAAPMPESVILRALERFPSSTEFVGAYGLTETTSTVAMLSPEDHKLFGLAAESRSKRKRLRSVGRLLDDVDLQIRDPEGEPLAVNDVGRICLRTDRGMSGYAGEATGGDDQSWVETGDLGYVDDEGYLFIVGRDGDMIIRGGENIAPQEVESVLLDHPDIAEVAVVGLPDEEWGQRVVAAVVVQPGAGLTEAEALNYCRHVLAGFKRPSRIEFVDELPYTGTGKLMRRRLLDTVFA